MVNQWDFGVLAGGLGEKVKVVLESSKVKVMKFKINCKQYRNKKNIKYIIK